MEHPQASQPSVASPAVITDASTGSSRPFGARVASGGTEFRVWAPSATRALVVVESGARAGNYAMTQGDRGIFSARIEGVAAGDLYRFRLDDGDAMPDPASRFQPLGVHGPSEVIDPSAYEWHDQSWSGIDAPRAVIYELHVGTFTRGGTFDAAADRLSYLRELGVTIIELMPVADFPGERNWGYDGVSLFAPSRAYGRPEDLRRFIDLAHAAGLAVVLDVVYNHFGPDGAYISAFAPSFFTSRHKTAWGQGVNVDGPESAHVRQFIVQNAVHWVTEYHFDGLRLDATHALADDSPRHIVAEIAAAARAAASKPVLIVAEDHRNEAVMLRETGDGGWGLDGVWADDFHHVMRRMLAGDSEGYYADFAGSAEELARTLRQGWLFTGERSHHLRRDRGSDSAGIPKRKFVICLQNHDQVGNRAFGDRLHHAIDLAAYRAASALLLLAPETPLLFMGQEWAASSPFTYFTDHGAKLGAAIVKGRRREFEHFEAFRDRAIRNRIPNPQDLSTFERSRLDWEEQKQQPHAGMLRLYRRCLELRGEWTARLGGAREAPSVDAHGEDAVVVRYDLADSSLWLVSLLRGSGRVCVPELPASARVLMTTADASFAEDQKPPERMGSAFVFAAPATVVLSSSR